MADISADIRSILETQVTQIPQVPSVAWENVSFVPISGQSYLQVSYLPISRAPAVRGLQPTQRYDVLLSINCYAPEGSGPSVADTLAKNVIGSFEATTSLTNPNNLTVRIERAERLEGVLDSPWYFIPVNIYCYCYN